MGAQKSEDDHPLHETVRGVVAVAVVAVPVVAVPNLQLTYSRSPHGCSSAMYRDSGHDWETFSANGDNDK